METLEQKINKLIHASLSQDDMDIGPGGGEYADRPGSRTSSVAMGSEINLFGTRGVDPKCQRFPHCIVWTPIPCLT